MLPNVFKALYRFLRGPSPARRVQVIKRDPCRLRAFEWRTTPDLVKLGAHVLDDPNVRLMLDTLRNESPINNVASEHLPGSVRSVILGRIEGYQMALNDFESLGLPLKSAEAPEATFEPPENDQPEQL